ncbi:Sensor histidine kinase/response regulator, putative [Penicillium digitatum]|uniref:Sensor histidine kinase/response regulator, putative n=3 Tax=Penicillium digitatum TaxID=36651 RepID=K9FQM0_PEND2|nr:Sensor histidine kinase/response regulator, putative [Penicillium digitatum Pd1]EKV11459.1 Sensor histidine kinase/response regulator, putative [Penicillium digitatum PHI26]EKV20136.1 Sensor histidine kinase/response regulator, putative [Penicillium digitatum Pd1]QQK39488.1 Sensor histidine kinase/response regulator, putative [Penicillium digitatum]
MTSPHLKGTGLWSPRKRSESVASLKRTEFLETGQGQPELRDRSQSIAEVQQPPNTGFHPADRVFPVRSVVSVDPTVTPQYTGSVHSRDAISLTREGARQYPFIDERTWNRLHSQLPFDHLHPRDHEHTEPTITTDIRHHETHAIDDKTELATKSLASKVAQHPEIHAKPAGSENQARSGSTAPVSSHPQHRNDGDNVHVTARFKHVMTDSGHAVITGRDGEAFQFCEDEPIRIPGAIQSFGLMIALREESPNQLVVRIVSENSAEFLGYSPKQLFELKNFCDLLSEDQADTLLDHIDFVRDDAHDPSVDGPEVFNMSMRTADGKRCKFWCATHVSQTQKDLVICEFEREDDEVNPLNVEGLAPPAVPADTLGIVPTPNQLAASTINISQPLRILRNARRRKGEASSMEAFSILTQIQEQLGRTNNLDQLLNTTAGLVKELTGFHRVLIYQFDSSWNGMVVAELVDPNATIDLYKGLHFPASDIPAQARELYKINKVRLLYDRDQVTSRLVCRTLEDLDSPLDMTHAYLRAMSPIHVKYLAHMKVRSSMSISVNAFNDLWGLISCHSYGTVGMRVSFPIRKMCRLLGDTVSRNIERLSYASRLQARKLINTVPTEANPAGYIIASSDDLLQLFDADYGVLSIRDETKILGGSNNSQEVLALLEFLRVRHLDSVLASHDIVKDFPDFHYAPGLKAISGLLYVPLSTGGSDFIAFFRRGQLTEIKWAGNPYEIEKRKLTAGYLEPRESFTSWRETVLSQSREWTETDVETAAVLCLVYGKFIKVWRQKEAAMQNSQLTRLLLANSAHEVRTPLNAIVNYLEIALEGALDDETRESLTKSHSASKSLIYVINDLLDLTNTEKGQDLIKDETFHLESTFREAADMLSGDAKRKNISYAVSVHPGIPESVLGDQRRVRQVLSNVISNAIQNTKSGAVTTEMWRSTSQAIPGHVGVEMMVVDTGVGMSHNKLERLFHELEQVSTDDTYYPEQEEEEEEEKEEEHNTQNPPQQRVLGLGLALAARIVHNMHGQLAVRSEEGKGSRFKIILHFRLPKGTSVDGDADGISPPSVVVPATPMLSDKEFTLVSGGHESRDVRRRSSESLRSGASSRSGHSGRSGKSHADRLISAMQEAPLKRRTSQDLDLRRPNFTSSPASASSNHTHPLISPSAAKRSLTVQDPKSTLSSVTHTPPLTLQQLVTPPPPGLENITDSGVPMGALRMSQHFTSLRSPQIEPNKEDNSYFPRVSSIAETSQAPSSGPTSSAPPTSVPSTTDYDPLNVLVAEDDPINSKIIQKRLTKLGHTVELTSNGEACKIAFASATKCFDVVLMDIQMPILDGMRATRAIREFESKTPKEALSDKAMHNDRVPIFAVSATLVEKDRKTYVDTGFDGWVMKPINFSRLNVLLSGLCDRSARKAATYTPDREWENGGWFDSK